MAALLLLVLAGGLWFAFGRDRGGTDGIAAVEPLDDEDDLGIDAPDGGDGPAGPDITLPRSALLDQGTALDEGLPTTELPDSAATTVGGSSSSIPPSTTAGGSTTASSSSTDTSPSTSVSIPGSTSSVSSTTPTTPTTIESTTTEDPAGIGRITGLVTVDGSGPAAGLWVALFRDADGDGSPEDQVDADATGADGTFSFTVEAGCYLVEFRDGPGLVVPAGSRWRPVCVAGDQVVGGIDLVARIADSAPPNACRRPPPGDLDSAVGVIEPRFGWADWYHFYDSAGRFVISTRGRTPDVSGPLRREWYGRTHGFDGGRVASVTAYRNGEESLATTCTEG